MRKYNRLSSATGAVARRTPHIKHWMPTQEIGMVREFLKDEGEIPVNLVIRVSSIRIDAVYRRNWRFTSSVGRMNGNGGHICPAEHQGNACKDCRACWSRDVPHVTYPLH